MRVVERPFSEFLRQPNDVVAELVEHDVVLRRRNAPALRLSQADRDDDRSEAFEALARLLRNLAVHNPAALDTAVDEVFGWATFLPEADRKVFVEELTRTLVGAADVENYSPVAQLMREWKATAEIHADPALERRLRKPLDADGEQVTVPAG
ncbi:MAG: DUF6247 family protein [Acidimicrobiales bacterium]